jgi:hypothetical protein
MADERLVMYDGFSDTSKHSTDWVQITKEFLKLAFAGGHRDVSCLCSRCENRRMLSEYEIYVELPFLAPTQRGVACGSRGVR